MGVYIGFGGLGQLGLGNLECSVMRGLNDAKRAQVMGSLEGVYQGSSTGLLRGLLRGFGGHN